MALHKCNTPHAVKDVGAETLRKIGRYRSARPLSASQGRLRDFSLKYSRYRHDRFMRAIFDNRVISLAL